MTARNRNKPWDTWLVPGNYLRLALHELYPVMNAPHFEEVAKRLGKDDIWYQSVWDAVDPELKFIRPVVEEYTASGLDFMFSDCLRSNGDMDLGKIYRQFHSAATRRGLKLVWSADYPHIVVYVMSDDLDAPAMPDIAHHYGNVNLNRSPQHQRPPMLDEYGPWLLGVGPYLTN